MEQREDRGKVTLKIFSGPHVGAEVILADGDFVIGRDDDCDIILNDEAIADRHARLQIANGATTLLALSGSVAVDGQPTEDGPTALPARTIFTLGTTHCGLAPIGENWREVVLPELVRGGLLARESGEGAQVPAATDAGSEQENVPAAGVSTAAATATDGSADEEGAEDKARTAGRKSRPLMSVLGVLLIFIAGALFWTESARQGKAYTKGETPTSAVKHFVDVRGTEQLVAENGLADRLAVSTSADDRVVVSGYLDSEAERRSLAAALRSANLEARLRIWTGEALLLAAKTTVNALRAPLQVGYRDPGVITLSGIMPRGQSLRKVIDALYDDIPGIITLDNMAVDLDLAVSDFRDLLEDVGLNEQITVNTRKDTVTASGTVPKELRQNWIRARKEYLKLYGDRVPVKLAVTVFETAPLSSVMVRSEAKPVVPAVVGPRPAPKPRAKVEPLPERPSLDIRSVSLAGTPQVVTKDGQIYKVGGLLPNGATIKEIAIDSIVLSMNGKEFIIWLGR